MPNSLFIINYYFLISCLFVFLELFVTHVFFFGGVVHFFYHYNQLLCDMTSGGSGGGIVVSSSSGGGGDPGNTKALARRAAVSDLINVL